ncbi:MAG: MotA/TolQ/ExbB proton channel family protein [Planctomycetia bacterium]|nr:MotA/TolQ/ExbB proton channel family protein [Planctomycetia bacterium]
MNTLAHIFYALSTALLIPTEAALLLALVTVALMLGGTLRDAYERRRAIRLRRELDSALESTRDPATAREKLRALLPNATTDPVLATLATFYDAIEDNALLQKRLQLFENRCKAYCERPEKLAKLTPALGLMGTLIPLGPALLGLAQGDLQTLSGNLVVAFSTTVVGLAAAALAALVASCRRKWTRNDFLLLNFALERLLGESHEAAS